MKLALFSFVILFEISSLENDSSILWDCDENEKEKLIGVCGKELHLSLWKYEKEEFKKINFQFRPPIDDVRQLKTTRRISWNHKGDKICVSGFYPNIYVYELCKEYDDDDDDEKMIYFLKLYAILDGHSTEVKCCSWSFDDRFVATCARDKSVWIWEDQNEHVDLPFECVSIQHIHSQDVKFVSWHPSKLLLLSASYDNTINIYRYVDIDTENDIEDDWIFHQTLTAHQSTVWSCQFVEEDIYSVSADSTLIIWKKQTNNNQWIYLKTMEFPSKSVLYHIDVLGLNIAICSSNGWWELLRIDKEKDEIERQILKMKAHEFAEVNCCKFLRVIKEENCKFLMSCGDMNQLRIWKI
ncbi:hypothetical protein SNEBB_001445 [Seison nebaliae]|nr:hypothetical protein SNEBB_001445 [Seison nebaliae]